MFAFVTFLSDFGVRGGYVAACEAVMAALTPAARVLHLSHEVGMGDVREGSLILARVAPLGPVAVHLAVVDPGVGTSRRALAVQAERGDFLVGPDNGLLTPAITALGGAAAAWSLDPERVRRHAGLPPGGASRTFHGRDLFSPATALLAQGLPGSLLGEPIEAEGLVRLAPPVVERTSEGVIRAEVLEIDRFGNIALGLAVEGLAEPDQDLCVQVEGEPDSGWRARRVYTYADLEPGELGLLEDSWGQASLSLNGASAAELLAARRRAFISLAPASAGLRADTPAETGDPARQDGSRLGPA